MSPSFPYTLGPGWSLLVLFSLLVGGCAGSQTFSRSIYHDPVMEVGLESPLYPNEPGVESFRHPLEIPAADLRTILRTVHIQKETSLLNYYLLRKDTKPIRVFSEDLLHLFSEKLHEALLKARPQDMVVFFLKEEREDGIPLVTTGGLGARGDQLALSLTNARTPVTSKDKRDRLRAHPLEANVDKEFHVVAGPYQSLYQPKSESRFANAPPTLLINFRALLANFPSNPASTESPPSPSSTTSPYPIRVEEKLRQLKTWYEDGLISEEEYRRKRGEVLESY